MSEVVIAAESRTGFGKGAARKIRREHKVPVVLYGHGTDPRHLSLPGHELLLALRTPNVLIRLEGAVDELAIPKGVQRDPIKGFLEHVDLLLVKRGEKVTVDIPVNVVGEVSEGMMDQQMVSVSVETEATHIPEGVEVDVTGLAVGTQITAGDLKLPKGTTLAADSEALVLIIAGEQAAEPAEGEAAESAEGEAAESAEAAEGESAE
ncbi:50S ribosomal protein L25/general stress protein Ctc [Planomonospora parontospora]|uniref:50S ribosomal protein L25/general stress protein Ctc n=1 Tax=Planomonospora parontospora TaxID=58119 RepID=UPI00167146F9|nr:50S ribosomal protein L25/general stress protein Ctc [Planomonospora parontospora]GGL11697.1 50S ribosomal protein L25 [Planomonospora parontospora subsp. antibiotica]GII14917.1 50S ribosomal protein L25 [Planomonospora parontospora subsp. antibiotica]